MIMHLIIVIVVNIFIFFLKTGFLQNFNIKSEEHYKNLILEYRPQQGRAQATGGQGCRVGNLLIVHAVSRSNGF